MSIIHKLKIMKLSLLLNNLNLIDFHDAELIN
jgi:hypothetical protein